MPAARANAPAVVLVHGLYGEPAQWSGFARAARRSGFTSLAYASRSARETDESVLVRDVVGAVRALRVRPEVDPDRIVLVGASVGGSAVAYALERVRARGGVAFSAFLGRHGAFRAHDLLLVSGTRERQNAEELRAAAHGRGVKIYDVEATGHGTALLDDPIARTAALDWLRRVTRHAPR